MSHHRLQQAAGLLIQAAKEGKDFAFALALLEAAYETSLSQEYKDEMVQRIEDVWLSRAKAQYLGKPSTITYKKAELGFFIGAMAAINEILPRDDDRLSDYVPPRWVFAPMSGDNIVKER
jgi:hypothetical protein